MSLPPGLKNVPISCAVHKLHLSLSHRMMQMGLQSLLFSGMFNFLLKPFQAGSRPSPWCMAWRVPQMGLPQYAAQEAAFWARPRDHGVRERSHRVLMAAGYWGRSGCMPHLATSCTCPGGSAVQPPSQRMAAFKTLDVLWQWHAENHQWNLTFRRAVHNLHQLCDLPEQQRSSAPVHSNPF